MKKFFPLMGALTAVIAASWCLAVDTKSTTTAQIGQPAPQFTLQNQDGATVNLSSFAGRIVVLEWVNPECPFVQRHYQQHTMVNLAAKYQPQNVAWLSINSSHTVTNADDKQWATSQSIPYPVLNDASGTVGHEYGATNTPEMYVINKDGKLVYKGAIDNDRDDTLGSAKVNYVDQALSEVLAGKSVSTPDTKPYGCTVKYAE
jgi:peroxiredoxin